MFWAPPFPITLGHESVGTVIEVGPKVWKFKVGDRITTPIGFWPGSRKDLNPAMGGFSEYGIARDGFAMAADGNRSLADDYNVHRQLIVLPGLDPKVIDFGLARLLVVVLSPLIELLLGIFQTQE